MWSVHIMGKQQEVILQEPDETWVFQQDPRSEHKHQITQNM